MPLSGTGTYTAPASSWNPAVDATDINSTDWIALLADLSTALSTAMYKDGQAVATANVDFAQGISVATNKFIVNPTTGKITATAGGIDVPTSNLGMVSSGGYTPTLTIAANLDAVTPYLLQYARIGNSVIVSGQIDINPTTVGVAVNLGISLPIASDFAAAYQCGGSSAAVFSPAENLSIQADSTNNRAILYGDAARNDNHAISIIFMYLII